MQSWKRLRLIFGRQFFVLTVVQSGYWYALSSVCPFACLPVTYVLWLNGTS